MYGQTNNTKCIVWSKNIKPVDFVENCFCTQMSLLETDGVSNFRFSLLLRFFSRFIVLVYIFLRKNNPTVGPFLSCSLAETLSFFFLRSRHSLAASQPVSFENAPSWMSSGGCVGARRSVRRWLSNPKLTKKKKRAINRAKIWRARAMRNFPTGSRSLAAVDRKFPARCGAGSGGSLAGWLVVRFFFDDWGNAIESIIVSSLHVECKIV